MEGGVEEMCEDAEVLGDGRMKEYRALKLGIKLVGSFSARPLPAGFAIISIAVPCSHNAMPKCRARIICPKRLLLIKELDLTYTGHNLVVILVLLVSLDGGLGNTVQITLAGLSDATTSLLLVVLEDADLLESLEDLTVDGAGGIDVVGWAGAAVLGASVNLPQAADTDGLAHVDVTGNGSGADVEPGKM